MDKEKDTKERICQRYSRCMRGAECPFDYMPENTWYGCFDRRPPRRRIEECSKSELMRIIRFAYNEDPYIKRVIEKGFEALKNNDI